MPSTGKFSCDGCGKTYTWKPDIAGRRVKCKCGHVMTVPKAAPAAVAAEPEPAGLDDLYALADGAPVSAAAASAEGGDCPSCGAAMDPGSIFCVECGRNRKTGKKLKTQREANAGTGGGVALASAGGGAAGAGLLGYATMATGRGARDADDAGKARGSEVFFSPVRALYIPAA